MKALMQTPGFPNGSVWSNVVDLRECAGGGGGMKEKEPNGELT